MIMLNRINYKNYKIMLNIFFEKKLMPKNLFSHASNIEN